MMMPLPSNCQDDSRLEFFNYLNYRLDQIEQDTDMNSLESITKSLFENRADILGRLAHSLIEKNFTELLNQEYLICPHCGRRLKALKKKVRREIETLIGPIELYRPYFYCKKCAKGFYPLDEALGLSMGVKLRRISINDGLYCMLNDGADPFDQSCIGST